jgi:hypothetical protein
MRMRLGGVKNGIKDSHGFTRMIADQNLVRRILIRDHPCKSVVSFALPAVAPASPGRVPVPIRAVAPVEMTRIADPAVRSTPIPATIASVMTINKLRAFFIEP